MKYIEKLIKNYKKLFGMRPKEFTSPLEKGDHPEIDTSELCSTDISIMVHDWIPTVDSYYW
jgi:hypothetical protein